MTLTLRQAALSPHFTEAADSLSAVEGDSASDSVFNIPDNISIFDSTRNQPHHQQGVYTSNKYTQIVLVC